MKARHVLAAAAVLGAFTAGCGSSGKATNGGASTDAAATGGGGSGAGAKACLVVSGSGVNDRSFNQAAWQGVQDGAQNSKLTPRYIQAANDADYLSAAEAFTRQPCKLIVTNGFPMTDATRAIAQRVPGREFAIVDVALPPMPNVQSLLFDAGQPSFLAGYLAAGMSRSGTVATYGGVKIPPLTLFMDGYSEGIDHYNQVHHTNVKLIGWNRSSQQGTFIGGFDDEAKGKQIVQGFIDQGADVVLGLGGLADQGAIAAIQQNGGGKVKMIWPNTDGCKEIPSACSAILTSVMKNIATVTQKAVEDAAAGTFRAGTYVGTLANGGVGISALGAGVPASLAKELDQVRQQIVAGQLKVQSEATPHAS